MFRLEVLPTKCNHYSALICWSNTGFQAWMWIFILVILSRWFPSTMQASLVQFWGMLHCMCTRVTLPRHMNDHALWRPIWAWREDSPAYAWLQTSSTICWGWDVMHPKAFCCGKSCYSKECLTLFPSFIFPCNSTNILYNVDLLDLHLYLLKMCQS